MSLAVKRILKSGFEKFRQDNTATGAALVVMTVALFVISSLFVLQGLSTFLVEKLQKSIDVSAYFKDSASEEEMLEMRRLTLELEEVKAVEYVSKEEALRRFIEAYRGKEAILRAVEAVGRNPLLAHLNVKAHDPREYSHIAEFLASASFASVIARVDFQERAPVIERLTVITSGIRAGVGVVIIVFSAIAVLLAFNTIRLAIYNSREEIEIMRLVGASNWFIRGPFLVQGALVGLVASILTLATLFGVGFFLGGQLSAFSGFDLLTFFTEQFWNLLLLLLVFGVGFGLLSSLLAIHKYLRA